MSLENLNNDILGSPSFRGQLEAEGSIVRQFTPQGFQEFIDSDIKTWAAVIKSANIQLD